MTEESFQQARKIMQTANHLRGLITIAKGEVAKWTNIEDSYKRDLQESKAEGARKMLNKALVKLQLARDKFAILNFPESNIVKVYSQTYCKNCNIIIAQDQEYCDECKYYHA